MKSFSSGVSSGTSAFGLKSFSSGGSSGTSGVSSGRVPSEGVSPPPSPESEMIATS
ncbi:MAG: hypothetical protein ACFFE4_04405 [Candidatus Thorarchaeota archaeon]